MVKIFFNGNFLFFSIKENVFLLVFVCMWIVFIEMKMHFDMFLMYVVYANILSNMLQDIFVIMFLLQFLLHILRHIKQNFFHMKSDSILKSCFSYFIVLKTWKKNWRKKWKLLLHKEKQPERETFTMFFLFHCEKKTSLKIN